MTKRRAFSLLAFIGYCFVSSNTIAMDLEKTTTPVKILTNSNSIDTNFGSTSQEKILPFEEFSKKWVDNLTDLRSRKEKRDITDADMTKAFLDAYNIYPNAFRTPIIRGQLTYYFPHGSTPQKKEGSNEFTPDRGNNIKLSLNGQCAIFKINGKIILVDWHHVEKDIKGRVVVIPRDTHRKYSGILHHRPGKPSRINRSDFAGDKKEVNICHGERLEVPLEDLDIVKKLSFEDDIAKKIKRPSDLPLEKSPKKKRKTQK